MFHPKKTVIVLESCGIVLHLRSISIVYWLSRHIQGDTDIVDGAEYLKPLLGFGIDTVLICRPANSLAFPVAVEQNIALILNELTLVVVLPESLECWRVGRDVVVADERLQVLGSLRSVVCRVWVGLVFM